MIFMRRVLKIFLFAIYLLLLLGLSGKLFFEDKFDAYLDRTLRIFRKTDMAETLIIGYSEPIVSLSPLTNDTGSRSRLLHVFEPLVRQNANLQIEPSLAVSFGSIDPLIWEFRIRPGVFFHDSSALALGDVTAALDEARTAPASGVRDLLGTVENIAAVDSEIFRITTKKPDPLLLQKLSSVLISKAGKGTGPYKILKNESGELMLNRFEQYWGERPDFQKVILKTFAKKQEKLEALGSGSVDIVANVPPDSAKNFQFPKFELVTRPSLEVNFLAFHFGKTFAKKELREAVWAALDPAELSKLASGFASPVNQFVGNGIFGFDPEIPARARNSEKLRDSVFVELDLPSGLEIFGKKVKLELKSIGFDVKLNFLPPQKLAAKIQSRESEFYFFGWRSELGDSGDFLSAAVHSPAGSYGGFNGGDYRNPEVDRLIEQSEQTVDPAERLKLLRAAMRKITVEDVIGVPLFSPEVLYGVSRKLKFTPRVDGYVLAQEVKI